MIIEKISIQILYPSGIYANVRPALEATLEQGDTPEQCLTELKQRLDNWFWETHPELSQQRGVTEVADNPTIPNIQVDDPPAIKLTKEERQKADIASSPDVKTLESYRLIVKKYPYLQEVYDETMEKLTKTA